MDTDTPQTAPARPPNTPIQIAAVVAAVLALALSSIALGGALTDDDGGPAGPVVELGEMFIEGDLEIDAGSTITVVNAGAITHDLTVEGGPKTPSLNGRQQALLDVSELDRGSYTVYCSIEGHRAAGMEATLVVR